MYFEIQRQNAEKKLQEIDSDLEEEKNFKAEDFYVCPVSRQKVNPDIKIINKGIYEATEKFVDQNPWAYQFDPKEDFKKIRLWWNSVWDVFH